MERRVQRQTGCRRAATDRMIPAFRWHQDRRQLRCHLSCQSEANRPPPRWFCAWSDS